MFKDENGEKSLELNKQAAAKYPQTYAVDYEEEKKRFEPVKVEEQNDEESHKDYSQPSYQKTELAPTERATSTEENHQRMGKTRDRKQLSEFQGKYLQPFRNSHRKAVYVSEETQRKLDFVVRQAMPRAATRMAIRRERR